MGKRRIPLKAETAPVDSLLGKPVEEETDLHGLDARGAELRVTLFIGRCAMTRSGAVVRIITGRGNRSDGGAVLKPLVNKLLTERLSEQVQRHVLEPGGGAYLVRLRERR
ncbi:MAG: Smr/MutS family protein [Gemmatimonadetes bacterium]|nr:Smr/MutS family protein [Gemmatimonadota bacterium]